MHIWLSPVIQAILGRLALCMGWLTVEWLIRSVDKDSVAVLWKVKRGGQTPMTRGGQVAHCI